MRFAILIAFLLAFFVSANLCAEPINRNILAVIDSAETSISKAVYNDAVPGADGYGAGEVDTMSQNVISQFAEMPLNHLGYTVDYVDVTRHLLADEEMAKYDAIISWFMDNHMKGAADYGRWITRQLSKGKKLIVLDQFGFELDETGQMTSTDILVDFFNAFSISFDAGGVTESPLLLEVAYSDPKIIGFERELGKWLPAFRKVTPLDKNARVFLTIKRKDTGEVADAAFVHSKGGYILSGYTVYQNPNDLQTRFWFNPFKFFAVALGANFPVPDVTTLNGSRIFMSHIDGDGIRNLSRVEKGKMCGDLVYEKILTKYNLPSSVSVIVGDVFSSVVSGNSEVGDSVRRIFALPNVEAASHGYAHPLVWARAKRKMALKIPDYTYSPQNEIGNSIEYINKNLVPLGKKTNLFFWTGDCAPDLDALAYVANNSIRAINGGDTRFSGNFASYTYTSPLFRQVDKFYQNLSASANEIPYTNIWSGPYYGFRYAIETFKNTESPIRLRPIDVYYHFFSMDRESAAAALTQVFDWASAQDIAPIFVSDYLKILDGFLSTKIERQGPGNFIIRDNKNLRTVRIDGYDGYVDMQRSSGVIGFYKYQGSLYVHLTNGEESRVMLSNIAPSRPYLVKANGGVRKWSAVDSGIDFDINVMGKVNFTIGGLKTGRHYIVKHNNKTHDLKADDQGWLTYSADMNINYFEWTGISVRES